MEVDDTWSSNLHLVSQTKIFHWTVRVFFFLICIEPLVGVIFTPGWHEGFRRGLDLIWCLCQTTPLLMNYEDWLQLQCAASKSLFNWNKMQSWRARGWWMGASTRSSKLHLLLWRWGHPEGGERQNAPATITRRDVWRDPQQTTGGGDSRVFSSTKPTRILRFLSRFNGFYVECCWNINSPLNLEIGNLTITIPKVLNTVLTWK